MQVTLQVKDTGDGIQTSMASMNKGEYDAIAQESIIQGFLCKECESGIAEIINLDEHESSALSFKIGTG